MNGRVLPTPPDRPGVPRFGIPADAWKTINALAWEYEHVGGLRDWPGYERVPDPPVPPRLAFVRFLYQRGAFGDDR